MFIGRKDELDFLESRYRAAGGQLVVLHGRRRVGKTETLRQFCEGKDHVFYSCTESIDEVQLQAFSSRMLSADIPAAKYVKVFRDWEQAFSSIAELPANGKKLVVIDEFPYMVKGNPSIPSILQNLWDGLLKNKDVMIVLCGSSMSFLEKEILAEKNPLYGRATGILKMNPMGFYEAIQFFPGYSNLDKVIAYAVLGGIPHYLKEFDQARSLDDNICQTILQRGSILYNEVEFLMKQALRETSVYNTILQAVAMGNTKLNEIFQKTRIDKSKLTVYLKNLTDLGIIRREFPVAQSIKEHAKVQRGLYQVADDFFRFWYAFGFPHMSEIEAGDGPGVYQHAVRPELEHYASHTFEDVSREYLRQQNHEGLLPFHFTSIGRWWKRDLEIDIMAADPGQDNLLVGECKFRNSPFSLAEMDSMLTKFVPEKSGTRVHYYLFSRSGFTDGVKKRATEKGVHLVRLDEML